jgi:hypothetical protein
MMPIGNELRHHLLAKSQEIVAGQEISVLLEKMQ